MYELYKNYTFFNDWTKALLKDKKLSFNNFDLIGGRISGKTFNFIIFMWNTMLLSNSITAWCWVRKLATNRRETLMTILDLAPENIKLEINLNDGTIKYNKHIIRVISLKEENVNKRHQKQGIRPFNEAELIFIVYEECSQMEGGKDIYFVDTAIRGAKEKYRLSTFISNPTKKENWIVKRTERYMKYDLAELKEKGYQYKKLKDRILLYTNHLFIKEGLGAEKIANLFRTSQETPWLRNMILYGTPSTTEAGIFLKEAKFIRNIEVNDIKFLGGQFYGGVDFGYGTSPSAGTLWYVNDNKDIYLIASMKTAPNSFNLHDDNIRLIQFFIFNFNNLPPYIRHSFTYFDINCDFDLARIDELNRIKDTDLFSFSSCVKWKIYHRVSWWRNKIAKNKVNIVGANDCDEGWFYEIENREWDIKTLSKQEPKVVEGGDHISDSGDYALADLM